MANERLTHSAIRPVKERVEDDLLSRPGVVGVDINEKVSNGRPTGELAIVVYVTQKKPKDKLKAGELIPARIDGIPTDVKEERIELHASRAELLEMPFVDATKDTTLHGGISIGPCRSVHLDPPDVPTSGNYIFVGTLGAIVTDRALKATMALTNFHVACVDNNWAAGDAMCQPGRNDGGSCPTDTFGSLTRATLSDNVDGAVVSISSGHAISLDNRGDWRYQRNSRGGRQCGRQEARPNDGTDLRKSDVDRCERHDQLWRWARRRHPEEADKS